VKQEVRVLIQKGKVSLLYDDVIGPRLQKALGAKAEVKRISHVEPVPGPRDKIEFEADLSPIGGPKLTGFSTHSEAVKAEVDWINQNHFISKKPEAKV
jgi:hypothetical protein